MKKMVPVYVLQVILIITVAFTLKRLTQHLAVIEQRLPKAAGQTLRNEPVQRAYVVNEADVRVRGTVDVQIENESLDVKVTNASYDPIPVEVDR